MAKKAPVPVQRAAHAVVYGILPTTALLALLWVASFGGFLMTGEAGR